MSCWLLKDPVATMLLIINNINLFLNKINAKGINSSCKERIMVIFEIPFYKSQGKFDIAFLTFNKTLHNCTS